MVAAGEAHELHRLALPLQRHEVFLALGHRAAGVGLAVEQQYRSGHLFRIGDGRPGQQLFRRVHYRTAPLRLSETDTDIGRPVHCEQVGAGCAHDRCSEPPGVADGPAGHESTVAVAVNTQPVLVHIVPLAHAVHGGHQVEIVIATPIVQHCPHELVAVSRGAAWVDRQHQIAGAGQRLLPRNVGVVECPVGTTVNVQYHRIAVRRVEGWGKPQPALDFISGPLDAELFQRGRRLPLEKTGVGLDQQLRAALGEVHQVDLCRAHWRAGGHRGQMGIAVQGKAGGKAPSTPHLACFSPLRRDLVDVALAVSFAQEHDPAVLCPPHIRLPAGSGATAQGGPLLITGDAAGFAFRLEYV